MSLTSLLIILASAGIHVVAHVALKLARDRTAFVWWELLWGGVLYLPVLVFNWQSIPGAAWAIMGASAVFEAFYFLAIARAYQFGDLSIIYPLARGTAPLCLLLWSVLFLGETATLGGVAGIALIVLGLYVSHLPRLGAWAEPLRALRQAGPRWALLGGVAISVYTALDRAGIRHVDPLLYTYLALWLTLALMTPFSLKGRGWSGLMAELRASRWSSVLAGFTTLAAYALVLYAMRAGTPASYAGAVREVSVVLGAAIGVIFLKESAGPMRLAGAACVALGVAVIAVLG